MKAKITSVLFFLSIAISSFAQQEALNQVDKEGKKDGKWIVYLDKDWNKLKDSSNAVYYRYNIFDHGANLRPMGPCGGKGHKLERIGGSPQEGKIKLLDGEYKWYNAKGQLTFEHILKNGEYVSYKEYYASGVLSNHFDYTKQYEGQTNSYMGYSYDKKGKLKSEWAFRKFDNGQWPPTRD